MAEPRGAMSAKNLNKTYTQGKLEQNAIREKSQGAPKAKTNVCHSPEEI